MQFLIVDDHLLVAQAVATLLAEFCGLKLLGICQTTDQLRAALDDQQADLLVLDVHMPGQSWLDVAQSFLCANPLGGIVFLTALATSFVPPESLQRSIVGVIDKAQPWSDLVGLIDQWRRRHGATAAGLPFAVPGLIALTPREHRVLLALGRGLLNKEIALELGLTLATVGTYRKTIASKLGVSGPELVRLAVLQRMSHATQACPQEG